MNIKQISIFLENKKGRLADVTALLAREKINIRALSLADTAEFGILRLIVDDPDKCAAVLKRESFVAQETDVIVVEIEDRPGGLNKILAVFEKEDLNIEYMYAVIEKSADNALVIFRIDDYKKAIDTLQKNGISLVSHDVLKNL